MGGWALASTHHSTGLQPPPLKPPTPKTTRVTSPTQAWTSAGGEGMGRQLEPTAHSVLPRLQFQPGWGREQLPAQNPRLAAPRSENSWAPGDKDKPPGCKHGQEKARKIWRLFLPGKGKWSPSNIHRTWQSCSSDSKFGKGRMEGRGCQQRCPFPSLPFGKSREGGGA